MKKFTYSVAIAATLLASSNTFAQQGFGTNQPDKSAAVEIKSSNKGLLIPRVELDNITDQIGTVPNANSLLVYNNGTALPKGYYYWDTNASGGAKWIAFVTSTTATSSAVSTTGDDPLTTTPIVDGELTTYDVKLTAGAENEFLVSRLKEGTTTGEMESVWVTIGGDISAEAGYDAISVDKIKGVAVAYENQGTSTTAPSTGEFLFFDGTNWTNKNFKNLVQQNQVKYTVNHATDTEDILWVESNTNDPDNITYTVHIDPTDLVNEGIKVTNALKKHELSEEEATAVGVGATAGDEYVVLGGNLIQNTDITLNGKEFVIDSDTDKFKVTGLTSLPLLGVSEENGYKNYEATTGNGFEVMINNSTDNSVRKATAGQIAAAGLEVNNGLNIEISATGSKALVQLGGDLREVTEIGTSEANTLAISGLIDTINKELETQNMIVEADGTLRKVVKSLELENNVSNIATATGYSPNIEEIFVSFNNLTADVNLILPTPSVANKGQVINVKILPATGAAADVTSHAGYLNLLDTYGSMFYQGWVLKSNGSEWTIVSRN